MFDLSELPQETRAEIQLSLDGCDFPFERCNPPRDVVVRSVAGLSYEGAWHPHGMIELNANLKGRKLRETFIHEVAHCVDRLGLTDRDRTFIDVIVHSGKMDDHPWLGEHDQDDYQKRIGEAWGSVFMWGWSKESPGELIEMFKTHRVNTDMARMARAFITPELPPKPELDAPRRHRIVEQWVKRGTIYEDSVPAPDWISNMIERAKARNHKVVLR